MNLCCVPYRVNFPAVKYQISVCTCGLFPAKGAEGQSAHRFVIVLAIR